MGSEPNEPDRRAPAGWARGLTADEVGRVLQRAAELDASLHRPEEERVDASVVEAAAIEAGLSRVAVRQALDELALGPPGTRPQRHRGVLGPPRLVIRRTVPGSVPDTTAALHGFLRRQLLEPTRVAGDRSRWVPRQGLAATVRRVADLNRRLRLDEVDHLDLVVTADGARPGHVAVVVEIGMVGVRRGQAALLASGTGIGVASAGTALLVAGLGPALVVAVPVGAGLAAGGHLAGRSYYRQSFRRIHDTVAGELDRLEYPGAVRVRQR